MNNQNSTFEDWFAETVKEIRKLGYKYEINEFGVDHHYKYGCDCKEAAKLFMRNLGR